MKIPETIQGNRIYLRSYDKNDVSFVSSMWFEEENGKYLSDPTPEFIDDAFQKEFDNIQDVDDGFYFIISLNSGGKIGSISTFPDENGEEFDIGYCIHKDYWKNGFGSEAVGVLLQWIKERGAKTVTAEVAAENTASRRLFEKLGFIVRKETEFKKYHMDISFDSYIYEKEL